MDRYIWCCSWNLLEPFSRFRGHGPEWSDYNDVIHAEEVADDYATLELVSIATLCEDMAEGFQ